ncbi:class I SAM-dependent DNA methyltransferase [Sulfurimonas sp. NW9]|uniref:class I SAM-dependent DNA methyltransferase n=1 Tax=Sulfurimonas sp. NW9 TaxID=2922728 RepID=UPI003DA8FC15
MPTSSQIEKNVKKVIDKFSPDEFIFDLLSAYDVADSRIKRLRTGDRNKLESIGELDAATLKLFFKVSASSDLHAVIDELVSKYKAEKKPPRFAIVTDYTTLLAVDTKTDDTLDVKISDLTKHYEFFLPLAGMEKAVIVNENPADVKAAEKMAKLYDEITKENEIKSEEEVHSLNVFLIRLLFCYFAEDSNIFADNQFTNAIEQHTQDDGSDLDTYIIRLFELLDTEKRPSDLNEHLKAFPYVNGGLFRTRCKVPKFTSKSRRIMIEVGTLDWSDINPDIFGSMIQAVITDEHRGGMGMHYTSVPNIMKVIEPLFLDSLYEEFETAKMSKSKLQKLQERLANLKIFDPACGSGNFLIIAYKELRALEIKILKQIDKVSSMKQGALFDNKRKKEQMSFMSLSSNIELTQFYGIELDDFAHEVAILSLWLTEHQMNVAFFKEFGQTAPPLPLPEGGHIVHGNATRLDWEEVCPKEDGDEIYILGNPPYLGYSERNKEQKSDMDFVFDGVGNVKRLDYIGCWFKLASDYINGIAAKYAFVSTNSISQGEQVSLLWPYIFSSNQEIRFAHQSFKWKNNARSNAGVTVVIIGIQNMDKSHKHLYIDNISKNVKSISPYLVEGSSLIIAQTKKSISRLPEMILGSSPIDGGHLILNAKEYEEFSKNIHTHKFLKQYIGGNDFLNDIKRYCVWIDDEQIAIASNIPEIKDRIDQCYNYRINAGRDAKKGASVPYRFFYRKYKKLPSVILPMTSSENREYLPVGFVGEEVITSNGILVIYGNNPYIMGVLSSKMHLSWVHAVTGKLESRIRYSVNLAYNTFPFPNISEKQQEQLSEHVFNILDEREKHSQKTLAQLYDPDKMPDGLREAHHQLDLAIEQCYRKKPFTSDEERLEYLFGLYEEMVANA